MKIALPLLMPPPGGKVLLQRMGPKCPSWQPSSSGFGRLMGPERPPGPPGRHGQAGERGEPPERPARRHAASSSATTAEDPLDPVARQAAQLAPPPMASSGVTAGSDAADVPATRARTSLEELLPALVKKVAWSGDGRKGTVRLELGAGGMAGAEVVVESEGGAVRVHLRAPEGVDAQAWRARIEARLAARGLRVAGVVAE